MTWALLAAVVVATATAAPSLFIPTHRMDHPPAYRFDNPIVPPLPAPAQVTRGGLWKARVWGGAAVQRDRLMGMLRGRRLGRITSAFTVDGGPRRPLPLSYQLPSTLSQG